MKNSSGSTEAAEEHVVVGVEEVLGEARDPVQLRLDGVRVVGRQHRRVGEELLAADDRDLRVIEQPRRRGRVGRDEDAPHPRRVHVDAAQRVAQLVDVAVARGPVVALADDVLGHLRGALPLEVARRAVDPREHQVDVVGELVGLQVEHAARSSATSGRSARPSVKRQVAGRREAPRQRVVVRRLDEVVAEAPELQAGAERVSRSAGSPLRAIRGR